MVDEEIENERSFLKRMKRLMLCTLQTPFPAQFFHENQVVYRCRTCHCGRELKLCYKCTFRHHRGHNVVFVKSRSKCVCVELRKAFEAGQNAFVMNEEETSNEKVTLKCPCADKQNTWIPVAGHRYRCDTCINGELCHACAEQCHQGHSISFVSYSTFVCRCGVQGSLACNNEQKRREQWTQTTDRQIINELECPVCLTVMSGNVLLCVNGHSICSDCRDHLHKCPMCRGELTNIRNITLEALACTIVVDCKQCGQIFTLPLLQTHLKTCPFGCHFEEDSPWKERFLV